MPEFFLQRFAKVAGDCRTTIHRSSPDKTPGEVAEWSIAPVLKTGNPQGFVSSNLTASASRLAIWALGRSNRATAAQDGRSQGV